LRLGAAAVLAALLGACAGTPVARVSAAPLSSSQALATSADKADPLLLGRSALDGNNFELATAMFTRALGKNPDSVEALNGLAETQYASNELERARGLYAQVLQKRPGDAAASLGVARITLRQRRLDEAVALYRSLVAAHPELEAASAGLGTALDMQGKHAEAQEVYGAGLASHPDSSALRIDLGLSLVLGKAVRQGVEVLVEATSAPSSPVQGRQDLAFALGMLGNAAAAEKVLQLDLGKDDVQNNLRYYEAVRYQALGIAPKKAAPARADDSDAAADLTGKGATPNARARGNDAARTVRVLSMRAPSDAKPGSASSAMPVAVPTAASAGNAALAALPPLPPLPGLAANVTPTIAQR
jgi:Flp pilus assembly protein TadD